MNVCFLANVDYCNLGYNYSESLKSVGVNSTGYALKKHRFGDYPKTFEYVNDISEVQNKDGFKNADVIVILHSYEFNYPNGINFLKDKLIGVFHGGSGYRNNHKHLNQYFNSFVDFSLIQTSDLFGLGAKNEQFLAGVVNTEFIKPISKTDSPLMFAHYPTDKYKGTNEILKVLSGLNFNYKPFTEPVSWIENIKRMAKCDVYVDALCEFVEGKKYGEWGIQTLEAAALGCVVITHSFNQSPYIDTYGEFNGFQYLNLCQNMEDLKYYVNYWKNPKKDNELVHTQEMLRKWVVDNHSYIPTGKRLLSIIEENL